MDLRKLKQEHATHIKWFRSLDKEDKELSAEQQTEYEKRYAECSKLKEQIERGEKHKALLLEKTVYDEVPKSEKRKYSFKQALKHLGGNRENSFEMEMHQELEKRTETHNVNSFLVPTREIFGKTTYPEKYEKRIIDGQTAITDDDLRPELTLLGLYENSIMDKLNVTKVDTNGIFNFPTGDTVAGAWFSGTGGSASTDKITEDDLSFSTTEVRPFFLGVASGWSLKQITEMNSSLSLEDLVRRSLSMGMATELDKALINGTNANNQPQGIFNWIGNENRTQVALKSSAPIRTWKWSDITEERKQLRTQFKNNIVQAQWVMHPTTEKELADQQRFESTSGQSILDAMSQPIVTGHMPELKVLYGDFSQVLVCSFQAIELSLGMISDDFLRGNTRVRAVGAFSFAYWRKEGFRQVVLTRSA